MDVYEPLRDQFAVHLRKVSRYWRRELDRSLRTRGITLAQWMVLNVLSTQGDGMVQKDIATALGVEAASLVRILDRLEEIKLIERRESPHDRRFKTVHLNDVAKDRLDDYRAALWDARHELLKDVDEEDLQACVRVFGKILSHDTFSDTNGGYQGGPL